MKKIQLWSVDRTEGKLSATAKRPRVSLLVRDRSGNISVDPPP